MTKAKFTIQADVDARIEYYIVRAVAAETVRDCCHYESLEYWQHHDVAMQWHEKALALMPKGS